ncbi:MAG TPA: CBS domain-containing protein [Planctomycetota bacterium]|nr:CBS domain-containing protein [Planctomycetota bacterium]
MPLSVRDIMKAEVKTVPPEMTLPDLERAFLEEQVSGFPVVRGAKLVGIISRSDVVRQLSVEQSVAEVISDYHRDMTDFESDPVESLHEIATRVGERVEHLQVKDLMVEKVFTVSPDHSIEDAARLLIKHHIHRVPVVKDGQVVGILTTLDIVRLFTDGRAATA